VPGHATSRHIDTYSTDEICSSPHRTSETALHVDHDYGPAVLGTEVRHVGELVFRPARRKALLATLNRKGSKSLTGIVVELDYASRWHETQGPM
jgi:hypothetical protein